MKDSQNARQRAQYQLAAYDFGFINSIVDAVIVVNEVEICA